VKVTAAGEGGAPPVGTAARDKYCEEKYSSVGFRRNRCKKGKIDGIGQADPVSQGAMATVLIAAAPVLVSLRGLLKDLGMSSGEPYDNTVNSAVRSQADVQTKGNGFNITTALPYIIGGGVLLLLLPTLLKRTK